LKTEEIAESLIISCDASVKENPGGPAAIGIIIQFDNRIEAITRFTKAKTNNQAEYDAVYESLGQLERVIWSGLRFKSIQIHSDSQLIVKQILGQYKCSDPQLQRKKELIKEKMKELAQKYIMPPVRIRWFKRNSTKGLKLANDAAQDALNVPRH
jgi:ribonuclease HI